MLSFFFKHPKGSLLLLEILCGLASLSFSSFFLYFVSLSFFYSPTFGMLCPTLVPWHVLFLLLRKLFLPILILDQSLLSHSYCFTK